MATLRFENINKIYDNNVQAVFDFNLEVKDREFIVFVGPSGCGKSTTLRMVAGLEDITYGNLYIDDILVNEVLPKDRDIAMVFQNYALFPHMTVYKNIAFGLRQRKVPMVIYEKNTEADAILEKNKAIRKQISQINRTILEHRDDASLAPKREQLKAELAENEKRLSSILVPVMGRDEKNIRRLEKELKKMTADPDDAARMAAQIERTKKELDHLKNNDVPLTKVRHLHKYEIDRKVESVSGILGLDEYLERKPSALSGGQRQRVALGRAIVRNPKVFLMDEPLSNLDAKLRVQMRSEIIRIHESVGATTIYVTHDQTEAMTMADRIVVMKAGYIQQIGTPKEVYNDPSNTFVAGFIGSPAMNFLDGTVKDGRFLVSGENEIAFGLTEEQKKLLKDYTDGKPLILGVRPEHCHTYQIPDSELTNFQDTSCYLSELLGSEIIAYATLNGQKIAVKTNDKHPVGTNSAFQVAFDNRKMYFFDKETGLRIKEAE